MSNKSVNDSIDVNENRLPQVDVTDIRLGWQEIEKKRHASIARLLNSVEVAERLRISHQRIRALRMEGGGPPFIKIGYLVRYRVEDVEAWIASRARRCTAESVDE